jgi:ABC-2 type transport system permease protein
MFKRIFSKKNRVLVAELVRTDFKLRYQGSALGYAWSLLRPLFIFLILYIVFVKFLKLGNGIPHYPVYLLLGIVLWNFFVEMTTQSLGSIVGRGDLIRKIQIPRWIIVISTSLSAIINLFLNLIVVAIFMDLNNVSISWTYLWAPLIIFEIYILALGVSFFLAAAFVKYRDISYVWEVLLQAGFYATPILYPLSSIHNISIQKIILLNPVAQSIQSARYEIVTNQTITTRTVFINSPLRFIPFIIVITVFLYGALYFKKKSKYFAEDL